MNARLLLLTLPMLLAGCDLDALLADPKAVQREADAKAIGGACRYGLRSIEDCYALNPKASKSAIFAGWKDMDAYMRENKVEGIPASIEASPPEEKKDSESGTDEPSGKEGTDNQDKESGKADSSNKTPDKTSSDKGGADAKENSDKKPAKASKSGGAH